MLLVTVAAEIPPGRAVAIPVVLGHAPSAFRQAAETDRFTGEAGTACEVLGGSQRVVLVGLGDTPDDALAAEEAGAVAAARLLSVAHFAIDARGLSAAQAVSLATGACLRAWRFEKLFTKPRDEAPKLLSLDVISDQADTAALWARAQGAIVATLFTRDLVTEPADTLTPAGFVARLQTAVDAGATLEILDRAALAAGGFGGLLAVGQASVHPPCLAVLRWPGTVAMKPVAFVGKGITFDTGGVCVKPADGMWEMRADMAGAAACAGAILAMALRRAQRPAVAVMALAENAIGADSYRPGDVLRMLDRSTVEVVDTDAEGRLVLADALTYARRLDPSAIVDLATLTGSIVTALGHVQAGIFSNDEDWAASVQAAGRAVGEHCWRMPIDESHRRALDSDIADLRHCSPERMQPDACHAAAFLREFVGETPWAHLDIAAMESRAEADDRWAKGATGFGVRLLDRLMADPTP